MTDVTTKLLGKGRLLLGSYLSFNLIIYWIRLDKQRKTYLGNLTGPWV